MSLKQGEDEVEASFIAKLSNVLFPFPSTYSSVTLGLKKNLHNWFLRNVKYYISVDVYGTIEMLNIPRYKPLSKPPPKAHCWA